MILSGHLLKGLNAVELSGDAGVDVVEEATALNVELIIFLQHINVWTVVQSRVSGDKIRQEAVDECDILSEKSRLQSPGDVEGWGTLQIISSWAS